VAGRPLGGDLPVRLVRRAQPGRPDQRGVAPRGAALLRPDPGAAGERGALPSPLPEQPGRHVPLHPRRPDSGV